MRPLRRIEAGFTSKTNGSLNRFIQALARSSRNPASIRWTRNFPDFQSLRRGAVETTSANAIHWFVANGFFSALDRKINLIGVPVSPKRDRSPLTKYRE